MVSPALTEVPLMSPIAEGQSRLPIAVLFRHIPDHGEHANGPTLIVYGVPAVEASHVDPIEKTNDECHP